MDKYKRGYQIFIVEKKKSSLPIDNFWPRGKLFSRTRGNFFPFFKVNLAALASFAIISWTQKELLSTSNCSSGHAAFPYSVQKTSPIYPTRFMGFFKTCNDFLLFNAFPSVQRFSQCSTLFPVFNAFPSVPTLFPIAKERLNKKIHVRD